MLTNGIITQEIVALLSVNFGGDSTKSAHPVHPLLALKRSSFQSDSPTERNILRLRYSWRKKLIIALAKRGTNATHLSILLYFGGIHNREDRRKSERIG